MTRGTHGPLPSFLPGSSFSGRTAVVLRERATPDEQTGWPVLEAEIPVLPSLVDHRGALRIGPFASAIDGVGGLCAGLAVLPDWVVTSELTMHLLAPVRSGTVRCEGRLLRRGRTSAVVEVMAHDDTGALVATAFVSSGVLTPSGGPPVYDRPVVLESRRDPDDPDADLPLVDWSGIVPRPGATATADLRDELRNPWGILHGGVTATLVDVAAAHTLQEATGLPAVTTSLTMNFLSPGRVGPVVARGRVLGAAGATSSGSGDGPGGPGGRHVVRVEVRDAGVDDRLMSVAITTVETVAP